MAWEVSGRADMIHVERLKDVLPDKIFQRFMRYFFRNLTQQPETQIGIMPAGADRKFYQGSDSMSR